MQSPSQNAEDAVSQDAKYQDRRQFPRVRVEGLLKCRLLTGDKPIAIECSPWDMSSQGLGVVTSVPVFPGSILELNDSPGPASAEARSLRFQVQWCHSQFDERGSWRAGLRLMQQDIDLIEQKFGKLAHFDNKPSDRPVTFPAARPKTPTKASQEPEPDPAVAIEAATLIKVSTSNLRRLLAAAPLSQAQMVDAIASLEGGLARLEGWLLTLRKSPRD